MRSTKLIDQLGHCLLSVFVLVYLFLAKLILRICVQMQTSAQFKFALHLYYRKLTRHEINSIGP